MAAAFFGPGVVYAVARLLAPALTALSPAGGFLASANLGAATRRFSSASTPLVLTVAVSCTFFFGFTTIDHATTQQLQAGLTYPPRPDPHRIGDRVAVILGDGTPAHATVVAIYSRDLAFGDAPLCSSPRTTPTTS